MCGCSHWGYDTEKYGDLVGIHHPECDLYSVETSPHLFYYSKETGYWVLLEDENMALLVVNQSKSALGEVKESEIYFKWCLLTAREYVNMRKF